MLVKHTCISRHVHKYTFAIINTITGLRIDMTSCENVLHTVTYRAASVYSYCCCYNCLLLDNPNFSTPPKNFSTPPENFSTPPKISQPLPQKFLNPPPPRKFLNPSRKFLNPPENISTPLEKISTPKIC